MPAYSDGSHRAPARSSWPAATVTLAWAASITRGRASARRRAVARLIGNGWSAGPGLTGGRRTGGAWSDSTGPLITAQGWGACAGTCWPSAERTASPTIATTRMCKHRGRTVDTLPLARLCGWYLLYRICGRRRPRRISPEGAEPAVEGNAGGTDSPACPVPPGRIQFAQPVSRQHRAPP